MIDGLNVNLSEEQALFAAFMSENNPELLQYWDFVGRSFLFDEVELFLREKSLDERIMMRFYLGVWMNENKYKFDFIEAMKVLNSSDKNVITKWANNPIYP